MFFLARSISSNDAPSATPRSLRAFSTDISNGAESSALELAWTGVAAQANGRRERMIEPLHGSNWSSGFRIRAGPGRRTGRRGNDEPAENRLGRTERVAAMFILGEM